MNNMELVTDVPVIDMEMEVITRNYPVIPNPEGTPTDDISTMEIDNIIYAVKDETARTELENKVDKVEGKDLSTNDYTDEDKAIVDGVTEALNGKVDKDGDKVLSDNNYSDTDKAIVDGVTEALNGKADKSDTYTKSEVDSVLDDKADKSDTYTKTETDTLLNGKVDKDGDKVLSDNNYSDTDKTKLDGIEAEANKTVVDNALDGTSANPVENRVVKSALDEKLNADETAVNANGLALVTPINDTAPYIYRQTPVKESFKALMHKIVGASVVWNQLSNNLNRSVSGYFTNNGDGSFTLNGTSTTDNPTYNANSPSLTLLANHVFLVSGCPSGGGINSYRIDVRDNNPLVANASWDTGNGFVFKINEDKQNVYVKMRLAKDYTAENVVFKPQLIDLTAMFGTTIADYVYTLEQATSGSGIAWLQSYGFFTEDYYAYTQNKLESGCVSAKKICGKNLFNKTRASLISATTCDYARNDGGIWLFEGVTYTLSIGKTVSSMGVYYYGGDTDSSNRIGYASSTNTLTFTPTKTTKAFIRIYANNTLGGLSQSDINTIQLEIGSTATSFEPYVVTTYPISPITLRGLFKLSTDKLTVDGDEYNADGSVTRKYSLFSVLLSEAGRTDAEGETYTRYRFNISNVDVDNRTLSICDNATYNNGGGEFTHFNINSSGNYVYLYAPNTMATSTRFNIIYPLATPTTEQTTPFTETEIVGSTEEFIDYEVAQGNRDVAIPVGTDTDYYQEMKLPPLPTTSGNHNLIYNVATGFGWS